MAAVNYLADHASQLSASDYHDIESLMSSIGGPSIRISNEPELRLEMRELDVNGKEWRFLSYAEEEKGILKSSSHAGSCCDTAYLKAIEHNLAVAKDACQLEMDVDYGFIEDVIVATKGELLRLQKHPELFASKDIEENFWHNVRLTCSSLVKEVIQGQEARDHAHKMFEAAWVEIEEDMRAPRRDMQRKPWEQFLHNRAPGAEADLSIFPKEGSVQIIPMAAARILMANVEEQRAIIRDIEAQREDMRPYAPAGANISCSKGLKHSPDGNLRSHQASTDLLKSTIAGPMDIVRSEDMDASLEMLNLDFAALNRQRPPMRSHSGQRLDNMDEMMNIFT